MTAALIHHGTPQQPSPPSLGELRLRAQWLSSLRPAEREAPPDLALAEVERRFGRWLLARTRARTGASTISALLAAGQPGA